jgi:hypothetical protein
MSEGATSGALVCGFGDLAAGLGGLVWDLGEPGAVLLSEGEARRATFALEEGGDDAALAITADEVTLEATLSARTAEIALDGGPIATTCVAEVRSEGGAQTVECRGQICRWAGNPVEDAGSFRQLAIEGAEEALLIVAARGKPGAAGHGEDEIGGWLIEGEDVTAYDESLISTQYDGGGDPTRLGLELWPVDADQTSRAAATRVSGSLLGGTRSGAVWAGFFRCHTGEAEGLGSYLLWRE